MINSTEFKPIPTNEFEIDKQSEDEKPILRRFCWTFYPSTCANFTCFWIVYPIFFFFLVLFFGIMPNTNWILPTPVPSTASLDRFSEERAFQTVKYLASMGAKTINSLENKNATEFIFNSLTTLSNLYKKSNQRVEIEYFNFQRPPYLGLRNIYARISDSSKSPDLPSVMLSAHFDSAPFSPGASDDEMMVASLLEIYRIMLVSGKTPKNPIIFAFVNGEENGLYGSRAFVSESGFWAKNVQRFINLDATGSQGKSLLYRSYPSSIINEYNGVPYPYAAVIGEDIMPFVPSDTDFSAYINFTKNSNAKYALNGMDMATFKYGYYYHTRKDAPDSISPGTIQQTGENILYLANKYTFTEGIMGQQPSTQRYVYFDTFGFFVNYPEWVQITGNLLLMLSITFFPVFIFLIEVCNGLILTPNPIKERNRLKFFLEKSLLPCYYFVGYVFSIILGFLCAVTVGLLSSSINSFSWYGSMTLAVFLYGFPTVLGLVVGQYIFFHGVWAMCSNSYGTDTVAITQKHQRERFIGLFYLYLFPLLFTTVLRIRSGYIFGVGSFFLITGVALCILIELVLDYTVLCFTRDEVEPAKWVTYVQYLKNQVWILLPIFSGLIPSIITWDVCYRVLLLAMSILERAFLSNADVVISCFVAFAVIVTFIIYLPFTHRGTNFGKIILTLLFICICLLGVASFVPSFTREFPQRFGFFSFNINDNQVDSLGRVTNISSSAYTKIAHLDQQNTAKRIPQMYIDKRVSNFQCGDFFCSYNTTFSLKPPRLTVTPTVLSTGTSYQFTIEFEPCNEVLFNSYQDSNLTNVVIPRGTALSVNYPLFSFYNDNSISEIKGSFIVPKGRSQSVLFSFNYWNIEYTPVIRDIIKNDTWATIGPNNPRFLYVEYNYRFSG